MVSICIGCYTQLYIYSEIIIIIAKCNFILSIYIAVDRVTITCGINK